MEKVDLRSNTMTRPTAAMRKAMADAIVGDDVFGEDPTVNRLQEMAAEHPAESNLRNGSHTEDPLRIIDVVESTLADPDADTGHPRRPLPVLQGFGVCAETEHHGYKDQ